MKHGEISFYVPSTFNVMLGNEKKSFPISEEMRQYSLNIVALKFTEFFGGNTITCGQGRWLDSDNQTVISEDVYIVSSLLVGRSKLTKHEEQEINAIAQTIKSLLVQDVVLWTLKTFDGIVSFV